MNTVNPPLGFNLQSLVIPLDAVVPLKTLRPTIKLSKKYRQIAASIEAIGLVELPVVTPDPQRRRQYFLLDGLLRLEVLKDLGRTEVECLVSTDDEAYTYNKRISRLSVVQEHRMIVRAIERGASIEDVARALNISVTTVRNRFRLLDGLCAEVIDLMADKHCPMVVLDMLKRMKPLRQMQVAELMVGQNNYTSSFGKALLAATPNDQLMAPRADRPAGDISREQIARLERELAAAQRKTRFVEETFGVDNLVLTVAQTYLARLLKKPRVTRWLSGHRADYLGEFQAIVELTTLASETSTRTHH